jgi:hypothetical protein
LIKGGNGAKAREMARRPASNWFTPAERPRRIGKWRIERKGDEKGRVKGRDEKGWVLVVPKVRTSRRRENNKTKEGCELVMGLEIILITIMAKRGRQWL